MEQKHCIGKDGNSRASVAQFAGLFVDGDVQSTRPQGERSRQATDPATNDGDVKSLGHHLLLSQVTRFYEAP